LPIRSSFAAHEDATRQVPHRHAIAGHRRRRASVLFKDIHPIRDSFTGCGLFVARYRFIEFIGLLAFVGFAAPGAGSRERGVRD